MANDRIEQEKEQALARRLAALPRLEDLGAGGRELAATFRRAGTPQKLYADPEESTAGSYCLSYENLPGGGTAYHDGIFYHPGVLDDDVPDEELFNTSCHEMTHALQFHKAAACHLRERYGAPGFFLRPADYLLLGQRMEQDAFAKASWLAVAAYPRISPGLPRADSEQRADVIRESRRARNEREYMRCLVSSVLDHDVGGFLLSDYYNDQSLSWYEKPETLEAICRLRRQDDFFFVRLDTRDILEIGQSFGPNGFGYDGALYPESAVLTISAENADRLRVIEQTLGVPRDVPTVQEALAMKNMSREYFLHRFCGVPPGP